MWYEIRCQILWGGDSKRDAGVKWGQCHREKKGRVSENAIMKSSTVWSHLNPEKATSCSNFTSLTSATQTFLIFPMLLHSSSSFTLQCITVLTSLLTLLPTSSFFRSQLRWFSSRLHLPLHNFPTLPSTAEYNYVFFQDYKCLWKRAGSAQYSITYGAFAKFVVFKCMHGWKISSQTLTWNMCTRLRYFIVLASFTLHVLTFEFWAYYILFIFDFEMDTPR